MSENIPERKKRKQYSGDFKQKVVEDMRNNGLAFREVARKYEVEHSTVRLWERIYLEEGAEALSVDKRGRSGNKGRPPKLSPDTEKDLITENQRLRAENDYLKKLDALIQNRSQQKK